MLSATFTAGTALSGLGSLRKLTFSRTVERRGVFSDSVLGVSASCTTASGADGCCAAAGRAAGAIAAINGLNVVVAPLFVLLYEKVGWGPFVLNALILLAMLAYALRQAVLRSVSDVGPQREATIAGLERSDEGGV